MTIVEAAEVRQRLTMPVCIDLMRTSLRELEAGNYTQPLRSIALLPGGLFGGLLWSQSAFSVSPECRNQIPIPHRLCAAI